LGDQAVTRYTNDRVNAEAILGGAFYSSLSIVSTQMDMLELGRLDLINDANITKPTLVDKVNEYVIYDCISPDLDSNGTLVPTGEVFIDSIIGTEVNTLKLLAKRRRKMKEKLQSLRWVKEQSAITINGLHYKTEDRNKLLMLGVNQAAITHTIMKMQDPQWPDFKFDFITEQGSLKLPPKKMIMIALKYFEYIQKCFTMETIYRHQIENSDDPESIDITVGWPERDLTVNLETV
jgi:hypothetical protein